MLPEQFPVDARLVVEALNMRRGDQPEQVVVSFDVLRQQGQMVGAAVRRVPLGARRLRNVDLAADDGLQSSGTGGGVEVEGPVHVPVVGDGDAPHAKLLGAGDQLWDATHPVEKTVLGVNVEMHEGRSHRADYTMGSVADR